MLFDQMPGGKMHLRTKVSISVILLFTISIATLITTAVISSRSIMSKILKDSELALAQDCASSVDAWMSSRQAMLQAGAKELGNHPERNKAQMTGLIKTLSEAGGFSTVYPGYQDGLFISSDGWIPAAGWDHRTRPWYLQGKALMKAGQPSRTSTPRPVNSSSPSSVPSWKTGISSGC
jgi:methyl-accepting chemotaxis protein